MKNRLSNNKLESKEPALINHYRRMSHDTQLLAFDVSFKILSEAQKYT